MKHETALSLSLSLSHALHVFSLFFLSVVMVLFELRFVIIHPYASGCSLNTVFFPRIFIILPPLPRKRCWATIGCNRNWPTWRANRSEVNVHLHCVENFENLLQGYVGEGWVEVGLDKTQFFLNTL